MKVNERGEAPLLIKAISDIGLYRECNEDSCECGYFGETDGFIVVCDGMGGASGGKVASTLCSSTVAEAIKKGYRPKMTVKAARNLLESAITKANYQVNEKSQSDPYLHGMGTTIVAAIIIKSIAVIAHVGDSRAYVLNEQGIKQITKDHSLVQLMIDEGKITPDEAKTHPDRNIITRAVGVVNFVDVDFEIVDFTQGDKLLLCTDGLSGSVEENELIDIINDDINFSAEKLVERALENGSKDNITVAVVSANSQGE